VRAIAGAAPPAPAEASAYLFGSVAEDRSHRESDVDVAVLLSWEEHPDRAGRFDVGLRLAGALEPELARRVDVVVLNDVPPLLRRPVVTTGRRLLRADPELDHAYVRDVQIRAADVEPWLRRFRAEYGARALPGLLLHAGPTWSGPPPTSSPRRGGGWGGPPVGGAADARATRAAGFLVDLA